jgi:hypothetical protein
MIDPFRKCNANAASGSPNNFLHASAAPFILLKTQSDSPPPAQTVPGLPLPGACPRSAAGSFGACDL